MHALLSAGAWLSIAALLQAQETPLEAALKRGDAAAALVALEKHEAPADLVEKLALASRIAACADAHAEAANAADKAAGSKALAEAARLLEHALDLSAREVPSRAAERSELRARCGRAIARALDEPLSDPPTRTTTRRRLALMAARDALRELGPARAADRLEVELALLPLLTAERRFLELIPLCESALHENHPEETARRFRAALGIGFLEMGKLEKARPLLEDYVALAPEDPEHLLSLIDRLPPTLDGEALLWLRPLVAMPAPQEKAREATWKKLLGAFYAASTRAPRTSEPLRAWIEKAQVTLPIPETWRERAAAPGFRTYRPPNTRAGKTYSGKDALELLRPLSGAWKEHALTEELWRWGHHLYALRRGQDGPIFIVYGFGPDLDYWYGHSSEEKGVTGKTARGDNKGGIEGLVADFAYGVDAKQRKLTFEKARPLAFAPAVRGASRRAWKSGDFHYDETFVSLGQVTLEILLVIHVADIALYEPELRALYAGIKER